MLNIFIQQHLNVKMKTVFTKTFLASDLFEADEHALEYATKRDILYLDLGPAVTRKKNGT